MLNAVDFKRSSVHPEIEYAIVAQIWALKWLRKVLAWECIAFGIQYNLSQTNLFKTEAFGSGFYLGKRKKKRKKKRREIEAML